MIQDLGNKIKSVATVLVANGFIKEAARLQALLDALIDGSRDKQECLSEIEGLCSVKSFGDLYVKDIDDNAWLQLLSEVRVLTKSI
ncbi:MAG: hypothetical protein IPO35_01615 [Uliginosibacterium sp.]|nr:hypothetical protein [Uliginosibacterium sp.]